jgi:hypothetical protein
MEILFENMNLERVDPTRTRMFNERGRRMSGGRSRRRAAGREEAFDADEGGKRPFRRSRES